LIKNFLIYSIIGG